MKQKIVIDTDIGTDVDDTFALAYAIRNPDVYLKAISTTMGNTEIRARIVRKLERMLKVDIPLTAGQSGPENSIKQFWTGIEEQALTFEEKREPFKNSEFPEYTKDTSLICIGPLTNIAFQLQLNTSIKNVKNVYLMGTSENSHNFKSDLEAYHLVNQQSWNIYQITKQDSERISLTRQELEELRGNPLGNFLCESALRWLAHVNKGWIDHTPKTSCAMYDVLTVSAGIGEDYVKFKEVSPNRFVSCGVSPDLKDKLIESVNM